MPEVVSFTAPGQVALVPCDAAAADPGQRARPHLVLRHLRGHRADGVPRLEPVPHPHLGPRPPAVRRRRARPSPTPSRGGATPRSARSSRSPTTSTHRRSGTSSTASGATAARRWSRPTPSPGGSGRPTTRSRAPSPGSARSPSTPCSPPTPGVGDRVAVFGQGVIGLLATRLATLAGADGRRRRHAAAPARRGPRDGRRRDRGGRRARAAPGPSSASGRGGGVDAAIELSGSDRALHEAVRSVVVDGTVVASGFYQGGAANLRLGEEFHHNRVRIVASQISGRPVGLGAALGPAAAGAHVHGPGPARAGRRARRWSPTSSTPPTWPPSSSGSTAATPTSSRPCSASPPRRQSSRSGVTDPTLDTGPRFPGDRSGVAILGCGTIAQSAHLPAYEQHGVGVTGVWSRSAATTAAVRERFPFVGRVYASAEELLADPEVRYVDLATGPEGRLEWIEAAVDGRQARARPEAADAVRRRPGAAARRAGEGRRRRRPGRRQPQRPLGPAVAGRHLAAARRARSARSSASPTCTTSRCRRWPARRSTTCRTCCSPTTSCTGSTSPAAGWPTGAWATTAGHLGAGRRLAGAGPAGRRPQPVVGHAVAGRPPAARPRRCASSATSSRREPGCPFWVHGTTRDAARQRAARLRPARARRRRRTARRCRCPARGSSTASPRRWAS